MIRTCIAVVLVSTLGCGLCLAAAPTGGPEPPPLDVVAHAGLSPEAAVAAMTVPEGFRVDLIAAEPDLHQPVAFTIDARGRLWVVEAHNYPIRAGGVEGRWDEGRDRIVIFEDTDGDGTFDHRKVFIENLNLVSGIEVGFGGVWLGAAPYFLFIPDRDGDDQPDGPAEILLDGWDIRDTHETPNAFIWGPDGWLYGCHGVFNHSLVGKPGTPKEEREPMNAGVFRYHPTRHEFEVFAWGTSNPWGVDFNDLGQAFITACVVPHLYHVIQGARYQRQAGPHFGNYVYDDIKHIGDHVHWLGASPHGGNERSDAAGGGHAHCGAMIYLGDNFPAKYRDTIFMCNIHGNRVNNDILERRGSGYVGRHGPDLLLSNDKWFRGINLKYGPDGRVFLIDWYDKQACHTGHVEAWDRANGRLYRLGYGEAKPRKVNLAGLSDAELVELQLHPNDWYVRTARRLLQERGGSRDGHAGLREILDNHPDVTRRLRALWALHVTGGLDGPTLMRQLDSPHEHLRAWAIQLALEGRRPPEGLLPRLASMAEADSSQVVRLYLASALQRLPLRRRWPIAEGLLRHTADSDDHNLPLMTWYGVEPLAGRNPARAMRLSASSQIPTVSRFIVRRAASEDHGLEAVIAHLLQVSSPAVQGMILEETIAALRGRARVSAPSSWQEAYDRLIDSPEPGIREHVEFIAVRFGDYRIFDRMREGLADRQNPPEARRRALDILLTGRDTEVVTLLHELVGEASLRTEVLRGLATYDHPATPPAILRQYATFSEDDRREAVSALASRPAYAMELLRAVEEGQVPRGDLSAFVVRQMFRFDNPEVNERLTRVWGRVRETSGDKIEEMARWKEILKPAFLRHGNRSLGRKTFAATCGVCHTLFDAGSDIGPNLTGSNRADLDYILEKVLDPGATVGADYQLTVIETDDGRFISGLARQETDETLTIRTQNETLVIFKDEILDRRTSELSMMPEGLLAELSHEQVRDLIAYLASPEQVPLPEGTSAAEPAAGQ